MSYREERVKINSFSSNCNVDDSKYSVQEGCFLSTNTMVKNGVLRNNKGLKILSLPVSTTSTATAQMPQSTFTFEKLWHYSYYSVYNNRQEYVIVAFNGDGKLCYSGIFVHGGYFPLVSLNDTYDSVPSAINFRVQGDSVMGFVFDGKPLVVWYCDEPIYTVSTTPNFKSICLHGDRLFAIDADKDNLIRFSSNRNPLDWTKDVVNSDDAGSLELNDYKGSLNSLISFQDSVFVFQDYGISKITAYTTSDDYFATNIYSSSSKIYANTAAVCGDMIYFLCDDGLYTLDGVEVKKVDLKLSTYFAKNQDDANSCFYNGKLYIACKLNYEGEEEAEHNNSLIEFDINSHEYSIIKGFDVCSMLAINDLFVSKLVIALRDNYYLYELSDAGNFIGGVDIKKEWESGVITLNSLDKDKILKDIYLISRFDIDIIINSDKESRTISVKGKDNTQRISVNLPGKEFSFKLQTVQDNLFVENIQLRFMVES